LAGSSQDTRYASSKIFTNVSGFSKAGDGRARRKAHTIAIQKILDRSNI
jgi:hypothetical protein